MLFAVSRNALINQKSLLSHLDPSIIQTKYTSYFKPYFTCELKIVFLFCQKFKFCQQYSLFCDLLKLVKYNETYFLCQLQFTVALFLNSQIRVKNCSSSLKPENLKVSYCIITQYLIPINFNVVKVANNTIIFIK